MNIRQIRRRQAVVMAEPPNYGSTEFGYTVWSCQAEGDKRLMAFLIAQFGNDHQAVGDLEALLLRASTRTD